MNSITYLSLLYYCSYVKLLVTLIKYVPQVNLYSYTIFDFIFNNVCDF